MKNQNNPAKTGEFFSFLKTMNFSLWIYIAAYILLLLIAKLNVPLDREMILIMLATIIGFMMRGTIKE